MKKAKMIGKKTLSVFLAVLMVLTAWVWVAPTEASAANGSYTVKFLLNCTDDAVGWDECWLRVYYKENNGRTGDGSDYIDVPGWKDYCGKIQNNDNLSVEVPGFPYKVTAKVDVSIGRGCTIRIEEIFVGKSKDTATTSLWGAGNEGFNLISGQVWGNVNDFDSGAFSTSLYPYVASNATVNSDTNMAVSDIGIPPLGDKKDVSTSEKTVQYYALDQYGVRYEPTSYSVNKGLSISGWSIGNSATISATNSATKANGADYSDATLTMNWKGASTSTASKKESSTASFKLYNPRYKITFNGNGGTLGTAYTYGYLNRPINADSSTATTNNVSGLAADKFPTTGIRTGYTFNGMYTTATGGSKVSASTTITADTTYYAHWDINQYSANFYGTKANDTGTQEVEYLIASSNIDYNTVPTPPSVPDYDFGDFHYTFNSWDKDVVAIGAANEEYRARYNAEFVPAEYGDVEEIIAEAEEIINDENYEVVYNEESRKALENVIKSVDYTLGRTSQSIVNSYVTLIRQAIDGLGRQKYSVLFIDKLNNNVIELRYPVYYADDIDMPEAPLKGYTTTHHYEFKGWEPSEDGDDITFVSKNMIIYAVYDEIEHQFTVKDLPSNCTTQTGKEYTCSCGYSYVEFSGSVGTEHDISTEWTVDVDPTCTTAGSKSHHCTRCSYRADITEIPALDHDFTDGYQGVVINPGCENDGAEVSECKLCGYDKYVLIPKNGHVWTEKVIAPTCTSSGYTIKTCSNCYDEDIVSFTKPIAHTYVEDTSKYIAPTCTGIGREVSYCSCGAQKVETVDPTGHIWNTAPTVDFEATCTTKGQKSIHCSVCDTVDEDTITVIASKGHIWGAEVCEQKESCGVKGLYIKACEVCGENSSRIVDARTHNYSEEVVLPTCTTKGYTKKTCNICGDVIYTNETPALNHAWTSTLVDATCEHSAYIEHVCGNDATHNYLEYVDGSNVELHTWVETDRSDADCENDGYINYECSVCKTTKTEILPKTGHNYGEWDKTANPATNDKDGTWTRECANCNDVETLTIPKGGHNLVEISKTPAKCNEKGSVTYGCNAHTNCPITVTAELPLAQHTISQKVTDATCTKTGSVEAYCSVCDKNCEKPFSTTETPFKAHNPVAQEAVAPTCTTAGYTPYKCSDCDLSYNVFNDAQALGHNYEAQETKAPGCTTEGETTYTCQNDNRHTYTETIPATGHTYDAGTVVQEQSCTKVEKTEYTCACGDKYTVITNEAKGHTYGDWETVTPATADKFGVQKRSCDCGDVEYGVLEPIGAHNFTETVTKSPTCTTKGEKSFTCSSHTNCAANYTAEIPATGHTEKIVYTAPTCIAAGTSKIVCETCGAQIGEAYSIPAIAYHNFSGEGEVTTAPTCTATGIMTYTCTTDGCTEKKTETIPAKGHVLTTTVKDAECGEKGSVVTECANCNDSSVEKTVELAAKGHIWGATPIDTKAADCENNGSETYKCQNCDATNVVVLPKLGHTWSKWEKTDATNTEDGKWYHKCSVCGKDETLAIPRGHSLVLDETNSNAATCEAEGKTIYVCESHVDCGVTIEVTHKKLNHSINSTRYEATCANNGSIERICTLCNKVISTETLYATAHIFDEGTTYSATCTQSGYVEYKCTKNCNYSYKAFTATDGAKGHNFTGTETVISAATCTADGKKIVKCTRCDAETTVVIPATGHNHVKGTVTAATCTTAGTEVYTCACGDTYTKFIEGAKAHTFGDWTETQAATADKYGIRERTCSACNTVEIGKIAPIGNHTFVETVVEEATCTAKGKKSFTCSAHTNCTANYTEEIPAKGHTQKIEYIAPSCTAIGYSKVVCSVEGCNALIMSAEIPAKGHAYNTVSVTAEAGCTSTGTRRFACACGEYYEETIPAKGHNLVTTVKDATCTEEGLVTTKCSRCNEETTIKELPIIEHTWGTPVTVDATCEKDGTNTYTCSVCSAFKTETIAKYGHSWGEWSVTKASTNTEKGTLTRKCLRGCTETAEIPAGNHNLLVDTANSTDASCSAEGTLVYKCNNHTDCGITVTVTVPMIQHTLTTTKKYATCTETGEVVTKCTKCETSTFTTIIPAKGHTITVTTTLATCTSEGSVVEYCEECKTNLNITTLAKLIHDYSGTETVVTKATCTIDGEKKVKCKTCDATTTVVIPKLGHIWSGWVKTEATNDTDGSWYHKCATCNTEENLVIPAGGHQLVEDTSKYVAPTCNTKGQKVYVCNNTAHKNCSVTVTVELDYGPHTIAQKLTEATCKAEGKVEAYCSVCDEDCEKPFSKTIIPVKAHVYTAGTAVDPTCTTSGYTPYTCSCGDTYNVYDADAKAKGHTLVEGTSTAKCTTGGEMTLTCSVSGCNYSTTVKVPELGHNYEKVSSTNATCAAAATETYKCSRCTASYTISVGEKATDHKWGAWEVKESATAASLGYKTSECTVCGQIKVETIPATGEHNFSVKISETPATCTNSGSVEYGCSTNHNCGMTSTVTIPATGHTEKHEYEAATCTKNGYSRMVCSVESCKKVLSEETITKLGHAWNDGNITNATCNAEGKIVRTCSRGCTDTDITVIPVNLNAHQYSTTVVKATCTSAGSVITKCDLCDKVTTNETLAQLQHTWDNGTETTSATCLGVGVKTFKCACGATKTEDIPALGHNWGAWTETKASTNNDKGVLTRTCSRGCTETAEIPAGGHNLVVDTANSKVPSCTESGYTKYICNVTHTGDVKCGITVTVTLDKLPHELEESAKAATCDTVGYVTVKCKNCNTATYTTEIPATGCAWNEGEVTTPATCTAEGTMTFTCIHDANHMRTKVIAKTQHNYIAGTPVAATCTSNGYTPYKCETCDSSYVILGEAAKGHSYTEKVSSTATCTSGGVLTLKCADCSETMETPVPAIGHDYEQISSTPATCAEAATETYKCNNCDAEYTISVGSKTDAHDWNDWFTVKEADYTSIGYKTRTCKVCGKLEVETINATGAHDLQEVRRDNPTCTTDGKIYYECKTEGHSCGVKDEVVISKLGHIEELRYTAPSCTAEGSTSIFCTRCNNTIGEERKLDKLDHIFEVESIVNATCKTKGEISFKCKCGKTKTEEIAVDSTAHKLHTTVNLATCTAPGSVTVTCENGDCNYEVSTPVPALQHNWSDWEKVDSTNSNPGSWTSYCSRCNEEKVLVIPAGGHKFENAPVTITKATCKNEGEVVYKCSAHDNCGVEVKVTLAKIQHSLTVEEKASTCTEEGYVKVYCSACDESYTNITLGKLAHEYEEIKKVDATCTTAGYTIMKCNNCDATYNRFDSQPLGHNFDDSIADNVTIVAAKCEADGSKTVKCTDCDAKVETVIPATGHKYEGEKAVVITKPTCTTIGYTTYTCDICNVAYTTNFVDPVPHNWGAWVVTTPSTNTTDGVLTRECSNGCTETAPIPAGGHTFDTTNPVSTTQGTCQTVGQKTFACTANHNCGITITVDTEFGGHDWTDWAKVDPTITSDGCWTRKCNTEDCGKVDTLTIPRGHNLVESGYKAAKCNETGYRTYSCNAHTDCGVEITVVLEKTQHTIKTANEASTCIKEGFVKTYCEECPEVFSNVTLDKLPHNYDLENGEYTAPKQNADGSWTPGYYTYKCKTEGCIATKVEGDSTSYTVRFFDANGNLIEDLTQIVLPGQSATVPEEKPSKDPDENYHYSFSGWDRDLREISKDLDVYPTYSKEAHFGGEATCNKYAVCDVCKNAYGSYDESKHVMTSEIESATCTESGKITYYCSAGCGKATTTQELKPMGHNFGKWEVYQTGSCSAPTIKIRRCSNHGCKEYELQEIVNNHTWHVVSEIAPTCTSVGYSEYKYCISCGITVESEVIPALGHRDNNKDGRCDYCTYVQEQVTCNCMCHSTGFMKFIYSIVRFFWRLTKSTPSCSCGAHHY